MSELTRLVLRLPEVESILQRAGLQPGAGSKLVPRSALEMFIKVLHTHTVIGIAACKIHTGNRQKKGNT